MVVVNANQAEMELLKSLDSLIIFFPQRCCRELFFFECLLLTMFMIPSDFLPIVYLLIIHAVIVSVI